VAPEINTHSIFEVLVEREMDAPADVVFDAITVHTDGWLWPSDLETLRASTSLEQGVITEWDPPHRFANRVEAPNGFFNALDHTLEERDNGRSWLRYVHQGVNFNPDQNLDDAVQQHTEFYLHTLNQYVQYFAPKDAAFVDIQGPASSASPDAFEKVRAALGLTSDSVVDDEVQLTINGLEPTSATLDYSTANFLGVRTDTALIRFFGRNAFGAVVGMTIHSFANDDGSALASAWEKWLSDLYR
jgi:uncharacterized protein YndB with AHSA1/START domain